MADLNGFTICCHCGGSCFCRGHAFSLSLVGRAGDHLGLSDLGSQDEAGRGVRISIPLFSCFFGSAFARRYSSALPRGRGVGIFFGTTDSGTGGGRFRSMADFIGDWDKGSISRVACMVEGRLCRGDAHRSGLVVCFYH